MTVYHKNQVAAYLEVMSLQEYMLSVVIGVLDGIDDTGAFLDRF